MGNSNAFSRRITTCTSQLRHLISFGGRCFQFFTKNRPQKHQKRAILLTSQANGGGSSPPAPPGYATGYANSAFLPRSTFFKFFPKANSLKTYCAYFFSGKLKFPRASRHLISVAQRASY